MSWSCANPADPGLALLTTDAVGRCQGFAELTDELVTDEASRLFAVVQELGEREDGWIAVWGTAFDGYADVLCDGGRSWMGVGRRNSAAGAGESLGDWVVLGQLKVGVSGKSIV